MLPSTLGFLVCACLLPVQAFAVMVSKRHVVFEAQTDVTDRNASSTCAHSYLSNGIGVRNYVINCLEDKGRLERFSRHMKKAGLDFEVFPCILGSRRTINEGVEQGYIGPKFLEIPEKWGNAGLAITMMKLLEKVSAEKGCIANIFQDDEIVYEDYAQQRDSILSALPDSWQYVNLNPLRPFGRRVHGTGLNRMRVGTDWRNNVWLSNVAFSPMGAVNFLKMGKGFDRGQYFDKSLMQVLYRDAFMCSVSYGLRSTNALSMHCETTSTKEKVNEHPILASMEREREEVDCMEDVEVSELKIHKR